MVMLEPTSSVDSLLLRTRFVRILGSRLISSYETRLPNGDPVFVYSRDEDAEIIMDEIFVQNIYEQYHGIEKGDTVLDVGANIGCFTIKACKEVGSAGSVLSFEPTASNYKLLARNVALNRYNDRCKTFAIAAGATSTIAEIGLYRRGSGEASLMNRNESPVRFEEVKIRPLDSITSEIGISKCDFLKIDVEGFEYEVLKGASGLIERFHPFIAMETHSFGPKPEIVAEFLGSLGYSPKIESHGRTVGMLYA